MWDLNKLCCMDCLSPAKWVEIVNLVLVLEEFEGKGFRRVLPPGRNMYPKRQPRKLNQQNSQLGPLDDFLAWFGTLSFLT